MGQSAHKDVEKAYKWNHNMFLHHHRTGMAELVQAAQCLRKTDIHSSFCDRYDERVEGLRLLFEGIEKEFPEQ